ncbi:capsid and scaffold protein [Escherichia phage Pride]|nr:capsid and scaffold protein [Escherichia phage Pride]
MQRADQIMRGVKVPKMFTDSGELMTIAQLKNRGLWRD